MRIAADQPELRAEFGDQLRLHHSEQIRPRRSSQDRRLFEGVLRLGRATNGRLLLQHRHLETLPGQEYGGHQSVVAGPNDDNVCRFSAHSWVQPGPSPRNRRGETYGSPNMSMPHDASSWGNSPSNRNLDSETIHPEAG